MKTGNPSTKREQHRAELLHDVFSRIAGMDMTLKRKFKKARQMGAARFLKSYKTFERLYYAWKRNPCAAAIKRDWAEGNPASSHIFAVAAAEYAATNGVSVQEACRTLRLPISYSTILRSLPMKGAIREMARLRRAQAKNARRAVALLEELEGRP